MKNNIIGITSIIPQNGAKYLAANMAHFLKRKIKNKSILILDFDFLYPVSCYPELEEAELSIDNLASSSVTLTESVLRNYVVCLNNGIRILKGSDLRSPEYFKEDFLSALINVAREEYDYIFVVFNSVDVNSGMIVTLLNANSVMLVVKNNKANENMAANTIANIRLFYPETMPINAVYNFKNRFSKKNSLDVARSENVKIKGVLEYQEHTIDNQNLKYKSSFRSKSTNDKLFKKWVKEIKEV